MTEPRHPGRSREAAAHARPRDRGWIAALCLAAGIAIAYWSAGGPAGAQLSSGTRERALDAFDSYDLEGPTTTDAIRLLGPLTTEAGRRMGGVPRLARARAAADLWIVAYLDRTHPRLERRVAEALEVPVVAIAPVLRRELERVDEGALADTAEDVREGIALREALTRGAPVAFERRHGLRRDALLVDTVGRALEDGDASELAAYAGDPCAPAGDDDPVGERPLVEPCAAPWSRWAPASRATIWALAEASAAYQRLERAWRAGDPFARAALDALDDDRRRLEQHVERPVPRFEEDALAISRAPSGEGAPARADLIVSVLPEHVRVTRVVPVRVREGRVEDVEIGGARAPATIPLRVPRAPGDAPPPDDALVARLRTFEVAPDASIAIAAAPGAPSDRLARVLSAMAAAQRAPAIAARRAPDGTLRAVGIQVVDPAAVGALGDVVLRLRPTSYAAATEGDEPGEPGSGEGKPDVARVSTGALDDDALRAALGRAPGQRVIVMPLGPVPAADVIDTAFQVGRDGDLVGLVAR